MNLLVLIAVVLFLVAAIVAVVDRPVSRTLLALALISLGLALWAATAVFNLPILVNPQ